LKATENGSYKIFITNLESNKIRSFLILLTHLFSFANISFKVCMVNIPWFLIIQAQLHILPQTPLSGDVWEGD